MQITTSPGFDALALGRHDLRAVSGQPCADLMRKSVDAIQAGLSQMPQYQPETKHYFHGGMYCREVYRNADVLVVGAVHKKEHLYVIVSGTVRISQEGEKAVELSAPAVIKSMPGTRRAVFSLTPVTCMTFHVTDAKTVEEAEAELAEVDPLSMYSAGNQIKHQPQEVLS